VVSNIFRRGLTSLLFFCYCGVSSWGNDPFAKTVECSTITREEDPLNTWLIDRLNRLSVYNRLPVFVWIMIQAERKCDQSLADLLMTFSSLRMNVLRVAARFQVSEKEAFKIWMTSGKK